MVDGMTTDVQENEKPLLAYNVQGDEYGCVVFASSNVVARRVGAGELDVEFSQVTSCRRMPEADKYAAQASVPQKALVEEFGWWQECRYCASMVSAEGNAERVWEDESLFCDADCQTKYHEREAIGKAERAAAAAKLAEVKELTLSRFPGVKNVQVYREWNGRHKVFFNFPEGKRYAEWFVGEGTIGVSECDVAAAKAFMDKVRAKDRDKLINSAITKFLALRGII